MKFSALIMAAGITPSLLSTGLRPQGVLSTGRNAVINVSPASAYRSDPFQRPAESNWLAAMNGSLWQRQFPGGGQTTLTNSTSMRLKPGVYKTEPYSCIVVVPGKDADDRSLVTPATRGSHMSVIMPDLRFIPFSPK